MSPANISIYDYMGDRNERNIFLSPVNEDEVIRVVRMCANKNYSDNDGITMKIVKHVITSIAKPFTYICNMSFTTGVFPDKMKIAKVVPLYKSGDRHLCNNYRPISLLPQFSKVLEKLFSTRLDSFVKDCDLLSASQYGFRQAMSTCHALVDLVETVTSSLDNTLHTIGIFIDLKKACCVKNLNSMVFVVWLITGLKAIWIIEISMYQLMDINPIFAASHAECRRGAY